jgi:hypothetical protein
MVVVPSRPSLTKPIAGNGLFHGKSKAVPCKPRVIRSGTARPRSCPPCNRRGLTRPKRAITRPIISSAGPPLGLSGAMALPRTSVLGVQARKSPNRKQIRLGRKSNKRRRTLKLRQHPKPMPSVSLLMLKRLYGQQRRKPGEQERKRTRQRRTHKPQGILRKS